MMKYLKIRIVIMVMVVFSFTTYGQKVGSTSMQFLKVIPSARGTALGDAFTVWATGAEAIFWNPAGLATLEKPEIYTAYINWLFDSQQGAVAYAQNFEGIGSFAIQIQYVDYGEFEESTNYRPYINDPERVGLTGYSFRPFSYLIGVSYARNLTEKFSLGGTIKFAHESLYNGQTVVTRVSLDEVKEVNTWANGLLFDFGIRYYTGYRSIYIGSVIQNFGGNVKYAVESHPVPLMFRFGIGANLIGTEALISPNDLMNRLSIAVDLFHANDYDQQEHLGLEYEYSGVFAVRAGYKFNYDTDGFTAGAGIKHTIAGLRISADYSYGDMGTYLGNVQRISLGVVLL